MSRAKTNSGSSSCIPNEFILSLGEIKYCQMYSVKISDRVLKALKSGAGHLKLCFKTEGAKDGILSINVNGETKKSRFSFDDSGFKFQSFDRVDGSDSDFRLIGATSKIMDIKNPDNLFSSRDSSDLASSSASLDSSDEGLRIQGGRPLPATYSDDEEEDEKPAPVVSQKPPPPKRRENGITVCWRSFGFNRRNE